MLKSAFHLFRPTNIMLKKIIKTTFLIASLFLSFSTHASDNENNDSFSINFEYADGVNIDNHDQYLVSLGALIEEKKSDSTSKYTRIALSMPLSDDNNPDNDFSITQIELGIGLKANYFLSPYIGAGIVVGEHERCTTTLFEETCEDKSHLGIYPEYGVGFSYKEKFIINIFARNYLMTEGVQDFRVVGISFGFYIN